MNSYQKYVAAQKANHDAHVKSRRILINTRVNDVVKHWDNEALANEAFSELAAMVGGTDIASELVDSCFSY